MKDKKYIDEEEKEIIESYDRDEWVSVLTEARKKELQDKASATLKKNRRINIRLTENDYRGIQVKALEEGIPYQSLVSMLIHKYIQGKIRIS